MTFESLLGRYSDSFLDAINGRSALRIDASAEQCRELVSWEDVNRLLEFGGLSYPRVRLVADGQDVAGATYSRIGANGYPRLMAAELRSAMTSGATLAIDSVEQLHEPISRLCQLAEERLRVPVQADLYATVAPGSTNTLQWNDHEAFVIQIEGAARWELHCPTLGIEADGGEPPAGPPAWNGDLEKGQVLYVPRGWWYREHIGGPTLYVCVTFRNLMAMDFVKRLTDRLGRRHSMQTDFPRFGNTSDQASFLRLVQNELAEAAARPGLILGCLQESQCFAEPRVHFALPWKTDAASILDAEETAVVWRPRFPGPDLLKHVETGDAVELFLEGRPLLFEGNAALVLERILKPPVSTTGEAFAVCRGSFSREEVAELLIDLMNSDVVGLRSSKSRAC